MPLIEADASALEVIGAAYLSQCPVLMDEILKGIDIHAANQKAFNLGEGKEGRLTAKIFKFRLIYGGNEYSYANDPKFNHLSRRREFWKRVIDDYYIKYYGMAKWHQDLVAGVQRTGKYLSPTGREFEFHHKNGEWPRTTILNYPVQSLGADIMTLIRISAFKRISRELPEVLLVNTVHDSIVVDSPSKDVERVVQIFHQVFKDFPGNFKKVFRSDFNLPLKCEVKVGKNWKEMKEYGTQ